MKILRYLAPLVVLSFFAVMAHLIFSIQPILCAECQRPIHDATFYRIFLSGDEIEDVCCPRCGLNFQRERVDVVHTQVADFYSRERFSSSQAYFVENSGVHLCCSEEDIQWDRSGAQYSRTWDRCLPSLVAFRSKESARRFQNEQGGFIRTYQQLLLESF